MKVRIRPAKAGDLNFVRDSFKRLMMLSTGLQSWQTANGATRVIERVLNNPRTAVQVAVKAEEDAKIVGYAVVTGDILTMVLVKRDYRRTGACRALLEGAPNPLRCWWPHRSLEHVAKCSLVHVDPLAVLEL